MKTRQKRFIMPLLYLIGGGRGNLRIPYNGLVSRECVPSGKAEDRHRRPD